ncbi:MAG: CsbD family protein [Puniceicoccaceae bacterium]|nr:MAG: CsbD family protein [Puniceicoccaceae bacterium]
MNNLTIKGNWNVLKGRLKAAYAELTDNDLLAIRAQQDQAVGIIQKRTGRTREEIESKLEEIKSSD